MPTKDFRIIFMGTPEFATASLAAILEAGFNVVAVVTSPDKPAGRGQKIQESDVKQFAQSKQIPVLQPEKLKDPSFISELQSYQANLQVVVAFRMLPEIVWNMPKMGTINLHASLLPNYRGAAPINWAIINGDKITGVSTFFIEKEIDTGKIIFSERVDITDSDTAGTLHDKLMNVGALLLVKTVAAIETGVYPQTDQFIEPGTTIKTAPKIFKESCKIHWKETSDIVQNFIRGLSPYPAAWATLTNTNTGETLGVKIFETSKENASHLHPPGTIITDEKKYLKIATSGGYISLLTLQLEGKKRLKVEEFLRGFKDIGSCKAL